MAAVAACATPEVDRTASFNQAKYDSDLTACRSQPPLLALVIGAAVAAFCAAHGAVQGALYGGGSAESAALGAIVGGSVGLVGGATVAYSQEEKIVGDCLREKGYAVRFPTKSS